MLKIKKKPGKDIIKMDLTEIVYGRMDRIDWGLMMDFIIWWKRLLTGRQMNCDENPGCNKGLISSAKHSDLFWVPHSLLFSWYQDISPGIHFHSQLTNAETESWISHKYFLSNSSKFTVPRTNSGVQII